jgi:hypothetical protein
VKVRLRRSDTIRLPSFGRRRSADVVVAAKAVAAIFPGPNVGAFIPATGAGDYSGPLAYRMGKPMRPDTAAAFDKLAAAARKDGIRLSITSAFRSDAEQARLFAAHPDPKWVAPPGKSLHRLGTELDLGPPSAYGWLARNARRHGFLKRYAWEPWHFGFIGEGPDPRDLAGDDSEGRGGETQIPPSFVPPRWRDALTRASARWNVPIDLLAAQLDVESNFNPFAQSQAGARGIAQFEPGTARAYGLTNPLDGEAAVDAQAHLMHDLLARYKTAALALAAYNAGPGAVDRYHGIPPFAETQGYVARVLGLLGGAGAIAGSFMSVRLVE